MIDKTETYQTKRFVLVKNCDQVRETMKKFPQL